MAVATETKEDERPESQYQKGVKHLCENGVNKVPKKYILPASDRPRMNYEGKLNVRKQNLKLPVIDFSELQGANRPQVLKSLANACEQYGFFQVRRFWVVYSKLKLIETLDLVIQSPLTYLTLASRY